MASNIQGFSRSGFGFAQVGFEFAPHLFNGIEVRRVGWQEENLHSCPGHKFQRGLAIVG